MNFFARSPWQKCLGCVPCFGCELQFTLLTRLAEHSASWWVQHRLQVVPARGSLTWAIGDVPCSTWCPPGSPSSCTCKRLQTARCLNQDPVLGPPSALLSIRWLHALRAARRAPELYEMHKLWTRGSQQLPAPSLSVWLPV